MTLTFLEFFAGGGMARLGLGGGWQCQLANDIDPMKCVSYRANFGGDHLIEGNVNSLHWSELGVPVDLAWASFPCQDLSLAGAGAGIGIDAEATRSGAFWGFWRLMLDLRRFGHLPRLIVLENVNGILSSNGGADFVAIATCLASCGYYFGAVQLDAADFLPQSRSRVFIVATLQNPVVRLISPSPLPYLHPAAMQRVVRTMASGVKQRWRWWQIPQPICRAVCLRSLVEDEPQGVSWHRSDQTDYLISMMAEPSRRHLRTLVAREGRQVGTIYRRTRGDRHGYGQRAELRIDGVAGCLRTPRGGSSRQTILIVDNGNVRSRLLSPREAARLMGLPEEYRLPDRYNDAYHVVGDGVVVPVVRYLAANLLEPMLESRETAYDVAAE